MLEQAIRKKCHQWILAPLLPFFASWAKPIWLTIASGVAGLISAIAIGLNHPLMAILFLLISGWLDMADGELARYLAQSTPLGAAMDIFVDRVVESLIVIALFLRFPEGHAVPALLMLVAMLLCVTSFLVVGIFTDNQSEKSFHYSSGLMERAEAFIFFILMILLPQYFTILAISFSLLVLWTGVYRMSEFARYG